MSDVPLERLYPPPAGRTTVADEYAVARTARPPAGRPRVGVCMIASIDGATAVAGRSGPLGNRTDRAVLSALREVADVVLVGAGTAAGEGYGAPRRAGLRIGVVTNSGRVDVTGALFASGAGFLVAPERVAVPLGVEVVRAGIAEVDLALALARLDGIVPGVASVSVEGGPRLNAALFDADLVDEIAVTTAPAVFGGASARLAAGAVERARRFELAGLFVDAEQYLFARWQRVSG